MIVFGVEGRGVKSSIKPESRDMNNPDTVEVGDEMEPRASFFVSFEENFLPFHLLQFLVSLRGRNIAKQTLVGKDDPLNTLGIPEELIDIVITNDVLVIFFPADIFAIHNFIALVSAVLIQRSDYLTKISAFLNRFNSLLTFRRVIVVVRTLENETQTFGHEPDLICLTPAEQK
jgi:hypothetical protein